MEFRNGEEAGESGGRTEESKKETDKVFYGNETKETEFNHNQTKNGEVAPKPSDVRNEDLVSLLLAATPPYLYNIPLVPQTFFFSEMLKSFVQAKAERQNLKSQQNHHRRQRKRSWREVTPPKPVYESRDKPLELTTSKQVEEKPRPEKSPVKKFQPTDGGEKKLSQLELGNFSVEKLANSSIAPGTESGAANANSGDVLPPAPPLWYPLLYPPHPPYGIDPLHFFIDLRVGKLLEVSAHFWDRTAKLNNFDSAPINLQNDASESPFAVGKARHSSAFRVPSPRNDVPFPKEPKKQSRNVHYVISSLKDIYKTVKREAQVKGKEEEEVQRQRQGQGQGQGQGQEEDNKWQKNKDLRALIGLELVVDYVKQESDGEEEKSDSNASEPGEEFRTLAIEQ